MTQTLKEKQRIVADINTVARQSLAAIAVDYRGLTVAEITALRASARAQNVAVKVVKNTLARRGLQNTDYQCMCDGLKGPLLFAFSREDPGAAARLIRDFAKKHDQIEIRMVAADRVLLDVSAVERLASMPTRDGAIALLMAVMQAPVTQLVRALLDIPARFVRVVVAVRDRPDHASGK